MSYEPLQLGQDTMANSQPVVLASDQSAVPVSGTFWQATQPVSIAATVAISAASLPLPTGAATSAKQDTIIGHVDGIETSLTTLTGAVSGTEMQVDIVASIPAGNNNIGDVDIASIAAGDNAIGRVKLTDGTDVADILDLTNSNPLVVAIVDGSGDQITSFGGGTQYTEDAAAAANPVGTALNLIRADSLAGLTSADGDNVAARGTDKGELYVKHVDALTVNSHAVTNAGTFAVQESGSALTALQLIDDIVYTDDTSTHATGTSKGALFMAAATPTDASVNANDIGAVAMTTDRKLHVSVQDALPAGTNAIGKLAANSGVDIGDVDVTSGPTGASAFQVQGTVAHDSGDAQNPVGMGANARTTNPTAVSDGDRVRIIADDVGRQVVVMNQVRDLVSIQQTTITSSTTETTIVTAAGAGVFADITQLTITNSSSTALIVTLKDATAGTTRGIYAIAANGGITISFPTPLPQATANNNWTLTCGSSVASIYVVAQYVKNV